MRIVENVDPEDESIRLKREKFKRQDTPLHPYSVRLPGQAKKGVPKSLSISVSSDPRQGQEGGPKGRTVSYDDKPQE